MAGGIGGLPSSGPGDASTADASQRRCARWREPIQRPRGSPRGRAIRELPAAERPRERLALRGAGGPDRGGADRAALGLGIARAARRSTSPRTRSPRHDGLTGLARATDLELEAVPGIGAARGGPARGRVRARPAAARRLAGRPLDDPLAARRRRPAGPPDGPPRARGAAGRAPQHEERRAPRRDGLPGQRHRRRSSGSASCSGTPSGSTRPGVILVHNHPSRRPDAVARTTST